jgi:hypothetical protein
MDGSICEVSRLQTECHKDWLRASKVERRDTKKQETRTCRQQGGVISLVLFLFKNKESKLKTRLGPVSPTAEMAMFPSSPEHQWLTKSFPQVSAVSHAVMKRSLALISRGSYWLYISEATCETSRLFASN